MLLENIANFDIGTHDTSTLPFGQHLQSGNRIVYACRRYNGSLGGAVHFLVERNDGSVLARSYATGRLQFSECERDNEEILAQLSGLDESSEEFNKALIAAIDERLPSREDLREALDRTEPAIDTMRESNRELLEMFLRLAKNVECDEDVDAISSSSERILAFDGESVSDIKTWHGTTNLRPLFEALACEFDF